METSTRRAARSEATVLETFLSGMETILRGHFPAYPSPPLKPSLVEWKPIPFLFHAGMGVVLETFLSGMETHRGPLYPQLGADLETFLSGMET